MKGTYICGGVEITVSDACLYVNGERMARFLDEDSAIRTSEAIDDYGDAMYQEGYIARGKERS